jgi:hypothetical protein
MTKAASAGADKTRAAYDDLSDILQRMCPQGYALLRHEGGTEIMRLGVKELVSNPRLAYEALGARNTRALARALLAVGERHIKVAERMLELAGAGEPTAFAKVCSRYNAERPE